MLSLSIIEKFKEYDLHFGNYQSIKRNGNKFYLPFRLIEEYMKNPHIFLSELLLKKDYQKII